ncbi:hypothetical protein [Pseudonocardia humida]|uniref:Excreted virulence factor EspC (Type VII ESX diderm) n=1 Tax=Pseudonocardia humida TaxID=2800819 RepID=A0ABT1AAA0_9PSEU|nr:hypothetical protein [Pseudonocardia humida]MCO1659744.1 hypothetical protein [Pseudonocardia humida]
MKHISRYVTAAAASALDQAAGAVIDALGEVVPRHVALSALLEAAAGQVDSVIESLVQVRAAGLAARLQALQERSHPGNEFADGPPVAGSGPVPVFSNTFPIGTRSALRSGSSRRIPFGR